MAIVDLVSSGLGLVARESDITPAWVEGVLRGSGHLAQGATVSSVTTERIGEGVGILSILQRVTPTYSAPGAGPRTVIVKYPTDDATQRFTADALALYIRELVFYRDCAPGAPFRTAACYGQAMVEGGTDFTIVMEDIGHLRALNQLDGIGIDDAKVLLDRIADFHAQWWGSPRLDEMSSTFQPISNPTYLAVLPTLWANGWAVVEAETPHVVPDGLGDIGALWGPKLPWMLETLMEPRTLCHGDYRADNILFDGDEPVVLDFQVSGIGSGMYDVGYFLSQSISTEVRQGRDRELVDHYLARLATHGITLDAGTAWHQYLACVLFCVTYGVTVFGGYLDQNERGQQLARDMLLRSLSCVAENNALDIIR